MSKRCTEPAKYFVNLGTKYGKTENTINVEAGYPIAIRLAHSIHPPCSDHPRNNITAVTPVTEVKKQPIKPTQIMGYERLHHFKIDAPIVIQLLMA
jgi:hypothetical protein